MLHPVLEDGHGQVSWNRDALAWKVEAGPMTYLFIHKGAFQILNLIAQA